LDLLWLIMVFNATLLKVALNTIINPKEHKNVLAMLCTPVIGKTVLRYVGTFSPHFKIISHTTILTNLALFHLELTFINS